MRRFLSYRVFISSLLAACFLVACKVERPEAVFSDQLMEDILCDYHKAKAMADEVSYNESYKKALYVESVFRKHGVTQAEFDSSLVWFSRHPDEFSKIYEKVKERLGRERDDINRLIALRDKKPTESQPGDSVDVWFWRQVYHLTGMPFDNKLTFSIPSDANFENRDTLVWSVRFNRVERDSLLAPVMALQILYSKDTLCSEPKKVYVDGMQTVSLSADSLGDLKEVRGFIYFPAGESVRSLLLDSISLIRYHATDSVKLADAK